MYLRCSADVLVNDECKYVRRYRYNCYIAELQYI